jgi:hypothetical protein
MHGLFVPWIVQFLHANVVSDKDADVDATTDSSK